jgi:hypothetical protein
VKTLISRLVLVAVVLLGAGSASAQNEDFAFHWGPSPLIDAQGNPRAPAVAYEVYVRRGSAPEELVATVADTVYTLSAEPGIVQRLLVRAVDAQGRFSVMSEPSDPIYFEVGQNDRGPSDLPPQAQIRRNYPNPFNPETRIVYGVPADVTGEETMRMEIYNLQGQLVKRLAVDPTPGWHEVVWDGTDASGTVQPTGLYLTRFTVGATVATGKMTMVK